ncbi:MAG: fumarylacetoacetate hydrolase family protein [Chloroflexi bacterium]|nr:fumarylacetoacetate hydrolase family protein [Chloroflexota bacterium]
MSTRIFCIGQNYVAHVQELGNELNSEPLIFMKPTACLLPVGEPIPFPHHGRELHQEAELVIQIGREGHVASAEEAPSFISGLSLGLDMTLRDVQTKLRQKGHPWELSKSFEGSAPIGEFVPFTAAFDLTDLHYTCHINGELRQQGHTALMIFPIATLIATLGQVWRLRTGDLIYTGTPAGVGPVHTGDVITVASEGIGGFSWVVGE